MTRIGTARRSRRVKVGQRSHAGSVSCERPSIVHHYTLAIGIHSGRRGALIVLEAVLLWCCFLSLSRFYVLRTAARQKHKASLSSVFRHCPIRTSLCLQVSTVSRRAQTDETAERSTSRGSKTVLDGLPQRAVHRIRPCIFAASPWPDSKPQLAECGRMATATTERAPILIRIHTKVTYLIPQEAPPGLSRKKVETVRYRGKEESIRNRHMIPFCQLYQHHEPHLLHRLHRPYRLHHPRKKKVSWTWPTHQQWLDPPHPPSNP